MSSSKDDIGKPVHLRAGSANYDGRHEAKADNEAVVAEVGEREDDEVNTEPAISAPMTNAPVEGNINFSQPGRKSTDGGEDEEDEKRSEDGDDFKDEDQEEAPYPELEEGVELTHPQDFKPFFTLVEDDSGEHYHPTVHYVFADDDPDILTDACLETLSTTQAVPLLDENVPDQRFVIVDICPDGKGVVSASSLSPDWQALQTKVSPAPSWADVGGSDADRGYMLTISGQEAKAKERRKKGVDLESLLKAFDESLESLDGVLGTGAARHATDTQHAQPEDAHAK